MRILTAVLCAAALLPVAAFADTYTYTYTGVPYVTAGGPYGDQVTGSLTLASPLVVNPAGPLVPVTPLSFSFSDGFDTITNASPNVSQASFAFSTPASGVPGLWSIDIVQTLQDGGINQILVNAHIGAGSGDQAYSDYIAGSSGGAIAFSSRAGSWTVTDNAGTGGAVTPEPGSLVLAATGVVGTLAGRFRARATAAGR